MVIKTDDNREKSFTLVYVEHRRDCCLCGEVPRVSFPPDSILVQVGTPDQSILLKKLKGLPTPQSLARTLKYTRGVVYCKDLLRYSEEKLSNQGVVRVERIKKKVDVVLTPPPTPPNL